MIVEKHDEVDDDETWDETINHKKCFFSNLFNHVFDKSVCRLQIFGVFTSQQAL